MTVSANQNEITGISNFIKKFAIHFKTGIAFQLFLIALLISCFIVFIITHAFWGTVFSGAEKIILSVLGLCLFFIALAVGIYFYRTKQISKQLYDEFKDILSYNYSFLINQHQQTIINTLNFNHYMMMTGFIALTIVGAQTSLTLYAVNSWSSTSNYSIMILNFLMLLICMGVPYAYNVLLKLSHHHLIQTGDQALKVLGKTILFTGVTDDPKVISPRYYQVIREIIGNGQHSNYVVQKITIIDKSKDKYKFQAYKLNYLSELKNIASVQDFQTIEAALLKNGIYIV
jgi:hypothetical protein